VPRTPIEDRPSSRNPKSGPRILLAEADAEQARRIAQSVSERCVVTTTSSLGEAEKAIDGNYWDGFIVDADLQGESGVALLARIRERYPREPLLLMCCCESADVSREAFLHRAYFVTKPLPDACMTSFQQCVFDSRQGTKTELTTRLRGLGLSPRETEVISLLAQGGTAASVGAHLGISARTVHGHCFGIYSRLNASNLAEVVAMANGWLSQ
jgi:DNA-binding NarL/FixJ family response regulator